MGKFLYILQPEGFQAFYEHLFINAQNIPVRYVLALLCASNDIRDDTRGNLWREKEDGTTQGQGSENSHFSLVFAVEVGHTLGSVRMDRGNRELRLVLCIRAWKSITMNYHSCEKEGSKLISANFKVQPVCARGREQTAGEPRVVFKCWSNKYLGYGQVLVDCSSYSCMQWGLDVPF